MCAPKPRLFLRPRWASSWLLIPEYFMTSWTVFDRPVNFGKLCLGRGFFRASFSLSWLGDTTQYGRHIMIRGARGSWESIRGGSWETIGGTRGSWEIIRGGRGSWERDWHDGSWVITDLQGAIALHRYEAPTTRALISRTSTYRILGEQILAKVPEVGLVHKIILSKHWWPINQLRTDNISQIYFETSAVIVNEIKYS